MARPSSLSGKWHRDLLLWTCDAPSWKNFVSLEFLFRFWFFKNKFRGLELRSNFDSSKWIIIIKSFVINLISHRGQFGPHSAWWVGKSSGIPPLSWLYLIISYSNHSILLFLFFKIDVDPETCLQITPKGLGHLNGMRSHMPTTFLSSPSKLCHLYFTQTYPLH